MLKSLVGSLLLFAFSSAIYAAEVRLGAERPLTPVEFGPAAYDQFLPAVASNGRDFFAVWVDHRGGDYETYGTRIGRDGRPRDPQGIRVKAGGWETLIASAGNDYLIVYRYNAGIRTQRLDENGTPIAPPRFFPGDEPKFLLSNGSSYLLVTKNLYTEYHETAILLDREGAPLRTVWSSRNDSVSAGVHNGSYVIVDSYATVDWNRNVTTQPVLHTIRDSGLPTDTLLPTLDHYAELTAAFSPDAVLLGWQQQGTPVHGKAAGYLLTDYQGRLHTAAELDDPPGPYFTPTPTAWWDGREFAVIFTRESASVSLLRIAANGSLPESSEFLLTSQRLSPGEHPIFAAADNVHIILWAGLEFSAAGDIVARTFTSFAAMASSETNLISQSGRPQDHVRVARAGGHELMAWLEPYARIFASVDGVTLPIAPRAPNHYVNLPAVAAGNGSFLVVWMEAAFSSAIQNVLAMRMTLDGRAIDSVPIVLWQGTLKSSWRSSPGIAFDGTTFLITWSDLDVFVARLPEDRSIRTATVSTFPVGLVDDGTWIKARAPQAAWTGNGFFVGYTLDHVDYRGGRGPVAMTGLRLDAKRDPPAPTATLFDFVSEGDLPLAMAVGAGAATFVWAVDNDGGGRNLALAQVAIENAAVSRPRISVYSTLPFDPCRSSAPVSDAPAIIWNGSEFVVAWIEGGSNCVPATLHAIRLNRYGDPLDDAPLDVATGILKTTPFPVLTPDGVDIVYSRIDAANGDAPRAFARSLARLPPAPLRQHAIR